MKNPYHSSIQSFVSSEQLPLWVVHMSTGSQPARKFHDHGYSELVLMLSGHGRHLLKKEMEPIQTGDILMIHPGTIHAYDETDTLELVNIIYDRKKLPLPMLDGYTLPLFSCFFPEPPQNGSAGPIAHLEAEDLASALSLITRLDHELKSYHPGSLLNSMGLFIELLVFLGRSRSASQQKLQSPFLIGDAVDYMNQHYSSAISIEVLARQARMSRRTFFRQFKDSTGCSPMEYLIRLRLHKASELLLTSNWNISEIAEKCGFFDGSYFCRLFRKYQGMPPGIFRARNLEKRQS